MATRTPGGGRETGRGGDRARAEEREGRRRASSGGCVIMVHGLAPVPPDARDYLAEAQEKYTRLERLYHVGAQKAWDGKQVLGDLLRKHGGITPRAHTRSGRSPRSSRPSSGASSPPGRSRADLALQLEDTEAKMAATVAGLRRGAPLLRHARLPARARRARSRRSTATRTPSSSSCSTPTGSSTSCSACSSSSSRSR